MKTPAVSHLVLSLIVALALVAGYAYWFMQVRLLEGKAEALTLDIAVKTEEYSRASGTKDTLAGIVAEEAEVRAHFVPTESIVAFLEGVEALGNQFGTTVTVVSVTDPAPDGRITLSLSISGSFSAVMRTLGLIEYSQYASATRSLTLDTGGDGVWTAAASVVVLAPITP